MRIAVLKYGLIEGFRKGWLRVNQCDGDVRIDWP
jgi:hypothetical protein